jgi:Trk K+ transport system NAD-binding subunit
VGAITREDGSVLIPRGDDLLAAHDQLVLFVLHAVVDPVLALAGIDRE